MKKINFKKHHSGISYSPYKPIIFGRVEITPSILLKRNFTLDASAYNSKL